MPHKKNPDVFELIRAKCNQIKNLPNEIMLMMSNLITGYHRDFQMIKNNYLRGLISISECLQVLNFCLQKIQIRRDILGDEKYLSLFTVEAVNGYVSDGMAFRDAYNKVAGEIESGEFRKPENLLHTHEGSKDNLFNEKIKSLMNEIVSEFKLDKPPPDPLYPAIAGCPGRRCVWIRFHRRTGQYETAPGHPWETDPAAIRAPQTLRVP